MNSSISNSLRSGLALAAFCFAPAVFAATTPATTDGAATPATPSIFAAASSSIDGFRYESSAVSSSSVDDAIAAGDPSSSLTGERDSLGLDAGTGQPAPGRRRSYGRSRYQDRMHNSDGSTRIAFMAGGGMAIPAGNTAKFYTGSWSVAAGAGINFNRMFGVLGEFHYDHMGLTSGTINTEYNQLLNYFGATADDLAGFDANAHVVSFTVNPIINFADQRSKMGAYVTGGLGWYRKTTNFTLPTISTSCNSYYCQQFSTTYNIDQAYADTIGYNVGFGLTYKLSEFSSERLFLDARYHWLPIDSKNNQDFFQYNRRNSEYIPVMVGIRF